MSTRRLIVPALILFVLPLTASARPGVQRHAASRARIEAPAQYYIASTCPIVVRPRPTKLTGGSQFTLEIDLDTVSGTDTNLSVSTDHTALFSNLPSTMFIPAGSLTATATVTTNTVSTSTDGTIYATFGSYLPQSAVVTVTP